MGRVIIYVMFIFGVAGPWFYGAKCMSDKIFGTSKTTNNGHSNFCPKCGAALQAHSC